MYKYTVIIVKEMYYSVYETLAIIPFTENEENFCSKCFQVCTQISYEK